MFKNEQCLQKYKKQNKLVLAYEGECVDFGELDLTHFYKWVQKSKKTVALLAPVTTIPYVAGTDAPRRLMQTSANSSVRCAWAKS